MSTIVYSKNPTTNAFAAAATVPFGNMVRIHRGKVQSVTPDAAREVQAQIIKQNPELEAKNVLAVTFDKESIKAGFGQTASDGFRVHSVVLSKEGVQQVTHPIVLKDRIFASRSTGFCN